MASKRMFSIAIINSCRFLRMSEGARLLYFDLGMRADDDGVCEAFSVMRTTGAANDALDELETCGFIQVLDKENQVVWVTNWEDDNTIRRERRKASFYRDLLPEEHREHLELLKDDGHVADTCQTDDSTVEYSNDGIGEYSRVEGSSGYFQNTTRTAHATPPSEDVIKQVELFRGKQRAIEQAKKYILGLTNKNIADIERRIDNGMSADVIIGVIDMARIQDRYEGWGYVYTVLEDYESRGILTKEQADKELSKKQRNKNGGNRDRPRAEVKWC